MLFLRRLLRLPTPVELGWSNINALGMREFTPYQEGYTWEDWREHCMKHHPVRYFLAETLPLWVKMWLVWPFTRRWDWVLDHVMPSRRMHILDLRGIDPLAMDVHGYLDPSMVFWLAGWGSLMRWHKESGGPFSHKDPRTWLKPEEWAQHQHQIDMHDELMALVQYWTVERLATDAQTHDLYNAMHKIPTTKENQAAYEAAQEIWSKAHRAHEQREQEMWLRLAAVKDYLWD